MEFSTETEAKQYALGMITKYIPPKNIHKHLEECKSYLNSASEDNKDYWKKEVKNLEEWINSDEFKNREYPRGIDELVLELIEWKSTIFALQNIDTENDPFKQHAFYAQWLVGGNYAIFCLLGKLVSKDPRDNSLRKLWSAVSKYISKSGLCGDGEVDYINERMHGPQGQFTNSNSPAILYRNKVIAHNESSPRIEWSDLDKDVELISRMWALVGMWSSVCLISPFRKPDQVFSGTESVFSSEEIELLLEQREIYLDKVKAWCTQCILTGERISKRSPVGSFSVHPPVARNNA